jgi:lipoprotein NlpD
LRLQLLALALSIGLSGCALFESSNHRRGVDWYRVKSGDTVYSIAWRYALDHQQLAEWNGLDEPYTIYPGQQLILAKPPKVPQSKPATTKISAATPAPRSSQPSTSKTRQDPDPTVSVAARAPSDWSWPTQGKLLNRFSYKDISRRGIDIAGEIGQPVRAVADGKVVYSGDGLANYGNLIIVKHSSTYLSAYAFNRAVVVKEGKQVVQGEMISEMGSNADNKAVLHFQIRKNGKPVDPLRYLPAR